MCMHVNDIYSLHNPGKPDPEYEGQRRKKENSIEKQLLPESTEILLCRQAVKVGNWQAGGGAWQRNNVCL